MATPKSRGTGEGGRGLPHSHLETANFGGCFPQRMWGPQHRPKNSRSPGGCTLLSPRHRAALRLTHLCISLVSDFRGEFGTKPSHVAGWGGGVPSSIA